MFLAVSFVVLKFKIECITSSNHGSLDLWWRHLLQYSRDEFPLTEETREFNGTLLDLKFGARREPVKNGLYPLSLFV